MTLPRLIEVALPIREISAESVRDKSLRHGHISTLRLWWARRRGELAFGYKLRALSGDPEKAYGVVVNPDKSTAVTFSEWDRISVLAEN